ncbi:MAG: WD40 repeat domain-containing protein [Synechococcaceae cyanobacterium RL_1_2]|nr:WD40 repeat domain-containing protein [Synechococcaceae cyanobacterium RL_1_2]
MAEVPEVLMAHNDDVLSVAFSPEGNRLVSGSDDLNFKLWDLTEGSSRNLEQGFDEVWAIAYSPDGQTLASVTKDHRIALWDVGSRQIKQLLTGHTGEVLDLEFTPNGTTLASGSADGAVRIWDVEKAELRTTITTEDLVYRLTVSPDGQTLATSTTLSPLIRLWDLTTGEKIADLEGHYYGVRGLDFSPDGTTLASCDEQGDCEALGSEYIGGNSYGSRGPLPSDRGIGLQPRR